MGDGGMPKRHPMRSTSEQTWRWFVHIDACMDNRVFISRLKPKDWDCCIAPVGLTSGQNVTFYAHSFLSDD
jgi:hypothetical protein